MAIERHDNNTSKEKRRMDHRRRLAVLQQSAAAGGELLARLEAQHWNVELASDPSRWEAVAAERRPRVGLALLDRCDDDLAARLRGTGMEWIAVVPKSMLADVPAARLVAETFHDFHTQPVDVPRLLVVLGHAHGRAALLPRAEPPDPAALGQFGMIGRSPAMLAMYRTLAKVAASDMPVLIGGESGTGKELAARAIHRQSPRAGGPFVAVNCGAIPVGLVQSELFGHEKGAFTGAHQRRIGSIEGASGGVVFLDEIGDLPLESQASLLRFLQDRTIVRVGSMRLVPVNARVLAATHVDLAEAVRRGRFREDLFYRLNVLHMHMPALHERPGDISLIAQAVLREELAAGRSRVLGFSSRAMQAMEAHAWPGNVRELINRVQKAIVMCESAYIGPEDLELHVRRSASAENLVRIASASTQRDLVQRALRANDFNVAATARELGISRVTLYRLLRKLEIGWRGEAADGRNATQ
jgi:DNA-binding NtrC family response regulator